MVQSVQIFDLLSKKANSKVLRYFLEMPGTKAHAAKLVRETGLAKGSVLPALASLEKAGLLAKAQLANALLYSLAPGPEARQLKILLTLSKLHPIMHEMRDSKVEIYLFGSAARGENDEKSDVDLLVISEKAASAFSAAFAKIRNAEVRPLFYSPMDYAMLARSDPAFYDRVEKDRIRVL